MKHYFWGVIFALTIGLASCQKAPELTLSGLTTIDASADGGSGTITFTTNRDWTATWSESWLQVVPSSGSASDGTITVRVRYDTNTTYEDRSATVTIKAEGLTQTVSVRQPANLGIIVPKRSFDLTSAANSIEVEVQANVQYTASVSDTWIKQTGTKGLTRNILVFAIEENKSYDSRNATIRIQSQTPGIPDEVVNVRQAQKDALIVSKSSYDMPYGGGQIDVKVEANVDFDVTPNADWIHHVSTKALSASTISLAIDENETFSKREGKVEIKQKNGPLSHTVTIKQAGRIAVTSVTLDKTSLTLKEGESETLTATVKPNNATDKTVTWSSSNTKVATVDNTGVISAIAKGEATITAKSGEKSAKCVVTVYKDIPVSSIKFDKETFSLAVGESAVLKATVKPNDATDKTVSWSSSDESIATVDDEGKITALAKGNATISAQAGDQIAECKVFVKAANYPTPSGAVDLGLSIVWADKNYGATSPYEAGGYYLWGDPAGTGVITIFETPNTDYISDTQYDIARAKLGKGWRLPTREEIKELFSACKWEKVSNGVKLTGPNGNSIVLPITGMAFPTDGVVGSTALTSKENGYLMTGESYSSGPRFAYVYHYNQSLSYNWSSYNASMAKFPVRPVFESIDGTIPVSSITLNKTSLTLKAGETETLVATVSPADATDNVVTWRSTNATIATVDENGVVTALKEGKATIYAYASGTQSMCYITVEKNLPEGNISFSDSILKEMLVAFYDSNKDGEISYDEAAAITSLKEVFYWRNVPLNISSFDEFRFFTNVKKLPDYAFQGDVSLKSIVFPDELTTIGAFALSGCKKLPSITIPKGVVRIESSAFAGSALTSIIIPNSVKVIQNYAFANTNLTSVTLSSNVQTLENTFANCVSLRTITIPKGIQILDGTFLGCSNLTSVNLPNSITTIDHAFSNCTSLSEISIPNSVHTIGGGAFEDCSNLKAITIPESVTLIDVHAFKGCRNLKSITILSKTVPTGSKEMFTDTNNCPIYVPAESVAAYKLSQYWSTYAERIQAIP